MQVRSITKPLAKLTCRWAEPCVAGMSFVSLITVDTRLVIGVIERTKEDPPRNATTFLTGIGIPT